MINNDNRGRKNLLWKVQSNLQRDRTEKNIFINHGTNVDGVKGKESNVRRAVNRV